MFSKMKRSVAALVLAGFFAGMAHHAVAAENWSEWAEGWKKNLGNIWETTKAKTRKALDPDKFKPQKPVDIGIAYGTEKKKWLTWAVEEFAKTEVGKYVKINLIPMGSVEGAKAVVNEDKRIHVWSPASSVVEALLTDPWKRAHNDKDPILSDAPLVLTPMVIVMWKDRYEAFINKYSSVNFKTIAEALNEPTGWKGIADKPAWGPFTFGHTKPSHSNSGLLALVIMGYDYFDMWRGLKTDNLMDEGFLKWLENVCEYADSDMTSTGTLMRDMLRFGPSKYNAVIVYENLALENFETAKGRWGEIVIVYPDRNIFNDNPYYILDVPWSSKEQQDAAQLFQDFLLNPEIQKKARDQFLFRPASFDLPIVGQGSSFEKFADIMKLDVTVIKKPKADVLELLINQWKRYAE